MPKWLIARLEQSQRARMHAMALYGADGTDDPDTSQDRGDGDDGADADDTQDGGDGNPFDGMSAEQIAAMATESHEAAKKARREAAQMRKRMKELETKNEEYEQAQLSESEKAQREAQQAVERAEALAAENRKLKLESAIQVAAAQANFRDVNDVMGQIDKTDLLDEDGELDTKALAQRLRRLAETKPYLLTTTKFGSADGSGKDADKVTDDEKKAARLAEMQKHYQENQGMVRVN